MIKVQSLLTCKDDVVLEREIDVSFIISSYKSSYNIDVSRFFTGLHKIQLFRCRQTGFRFFYPFSVAGDGTFYEELEKLPWYYMDWKWEHGMALKLIKKKDKILEIGCARGGFLERLRQEGIDGTGLELNERAAAVGRKKGLNIINQLVQDHAAEHPRRYDCVCSFQVMEHIAPIGEVIQASINALKQGGTLLISVPNNDSFLGYDENLLNIPPHHMGLWNKTSLGSLQQVYEIKLRKIHFEPLQPYHQEYFARVLPEIRKRHATKRVHKYGVGGKIINKFVSRVSDKLYASINPGLQSFTIIAEYEKL